jgi:prepilin-type processing-associated H-X9-DG protein
MRLVFLIPALRTGRLPTMWADLAKRARSNPLGRWAYARHFSVSQVFGGALNILRHAAIAQATGAEIAIATTDGRDSYGDVFGDGTRFSFIRWDERQSTDVCIVPDFVSLLADDVQGRTIVFQQSPLHLKADFDFRRAGISVWTDSPFMLRLCEQRFPGLQIPIAPNVVDDRLFSYVPQSQRRQGLLFAFPRKNPEFIEETWRRYLEGGGRYWRLELIEGMNIAGLANRFREPQAFLASAANEGCALPPQEAMAAGVAVLGRTANGANFCMQDGHTSLNAETPESAAEGLRRLEDEALRERLTVAARGFISRYFPHAEPRQFWESRIAELRDAKDAHAPLAGRPMRPVAAL